MLKSLNKKNKKISSYSKCQIYEIVWMLIQQVKHLILLKKGIQKNFDLDVFNSGFQ